jgi:elongation factor Ts
MAVTAAMVKELRQRTGLGMMDCKKALEVVDGDLEAAIDELRKKSALKAATKAGRTTADGLLALMVADDCKKAAMVEVNVETDFAARNEKFIGFVDTVLQAVFESESNDVAAVMAGALDDDREKLVQAIGENITVRRVVALATSSGRISSYLHGDNRKAALVELTAGDAELGRNVAMHITAISPMVVNSGEVAPDIIDKEREIYLAQAQDSGKPDDIVAKMVEGRLKKYLAEVSLVDQPFVKEPGKKVGELLEENGAACVRFHRFEVGEGMEKRDEDFAAEVAAAAQVKGS